MHWFWVKTLYLTARTATLETIQVCASLLPFCVVKGQGEIAGCQFFPLEDVVQCSESQCSCARLASGRFLIKAVKPRQIWQAVMIYEGCQGVDAATPQPAIPLHCTAGPR